MLAYRALITLATPPILLWQGLRLLRGAETRADFAERLGWTAATPPPGDGPVLWVHGASVGEVASARTLIEDLLAAHPRLRILATANTRTGRETLAGWGLDRLRARLAPLDLRRSVVAFIDAHGIDALLTLESEIWPNRIVAMQRAGKPVAVVGARLSRRSADRWRRFAPRLARRVLSALTLLSAQSADSAERFRDLGLPTAAMAPPAMLKAGVALPEPDPAALARFRRVYHRADTVLAASTHPGEEGAILRGYASACARRPGLRLILAPRHPERGADVADLVADAGLTCRRRSTGEGPDTDSDVYLADTLGEMPLWYALAGACFVGGSFVAKGGHTPYEPARMGCAILHGPDVANFSEAYGRLAAEGAALRVDTADALARALGGLDAARTEALGEAARAILGAADGAAERADLVARLGAMLPLD